MADGERSAPGGGSAAPGPTKLSMLGSMFLPGPEGFSGGTTGEDGDPEKKLEPWSMAHRVLWFQDPAQQHLGFKDLQADGRQVRWFQKNLLVLR